jgi:hypothetical protein
MKPLTSKLEQVQESFDRVRAYMHEHDFSLGGNWDYDHGYFDRSLDEANKVWLRIPFQVMTGRLEGDTEATDAYIQIGTPFVLNHLYNEGLETGADTDTVGALVNQFQTPKDTDAEVEDRWVQEATTLLNKLESHWHLQ